jgi:hypothetical protein
MKAGDEALEFELVAAGGPRFVLRKKSSDLYMSSKLGKLFLQKLPDAKHPDATRFLLIVVPPPK